MRETDFGRESYDRPKLAQPSSFPAELHQESPSKEVSSASHSSCKRAQHKWSAHAEELSRRGQLMELMQKSSAQEVSSCSSCRRDQHKKSAHAAHAGELITAHAEESSHSSCRRAQYCSCRRAQPQLMQKSSAQLMQKSSA